MSVSENVKFTKEHEWIKVEGETALIGITDYAAGELGDIVFVDIDPDLENIVSGETFGSIEAVKTVSDLYAPLDGKILEINEALEDAPETINDDPFGDGWIIKIQLDNPSQLDELLDESAYKAQLG